MKDILSFVMGPWIRMDSRLRGRKDIGMIWMQNAVMMKNTETAKAWRQRKRYLGIKNGNEMIRENANGKKDNIHVPQLPNRLFLELLDMEFCAGYLN